MAPGATLDGDAERRRARALQLLQAAPSKNQSETPRPDAAARPQKPVIDMTRPRLRLFAKSGEFPRAEHD